MIEHMREVMEMLFTLNSFSGMYDHPLIAVLRNTNLVDGGLIPAADTGENLCDVVLLIDQESVKFLSGRTYPHKKYQLQQVQRTANACYIASGWYPQVWIKGDHLGRFPALVEYRPFMIWRSTDMVLGNNDDYNQYDIVGDNFHGFAPYSAGCVTVRGAMEPPAEDWKIAHDWIYGKPDTIFSAVIFNFRDLASINDGTNKQRIGSAGERVTRMQNTLQKAYPEVLADGEFGPMTHNIIRKFQAARGLADDGICGPVTLAEMEKT